LAHLAGNAEHFFGTNVSSEQLLLVLAVKEHAGIYRDTSSPDKSPDSAFYDANLFSRYFKA
jgi:hypothetical protein